MKSFKELVLQDDENFLVELISWQDKPAIRKTAKFTTPKTRADRLQNDVLGMQFFAGLVHKNPNLDLHIPKVYESTTDFYIREYIDSPQFLEESASLEQAKDKLDKLAALLADIDRIEPSRHIGYFGSSNYKNLEQSIPRWADENLQDKLIMDVQNKRVKQISAGLGEYIQPRIAHGDVSTYKHTYIADDGKIALIDFENFTSAAARYFDMAWTYTRLYSFAKTTEIPRYFLTTFMKKSETTDHKDKQLFAVILQRTLGMQKDADKDLKTKGVDYCSRAHELLDLVLQDRLELLHD
ncbi:MAG: hypothetical protein ACREGG_02950 [Candidatus Saccharimonadales bacterium]